MPKTNLRKEARGRNCTYRAPGVCKNDRDTVVLCHTNESRAARAGMGIKPHDVLAFFGCDACHSLADGRVTSSEYSYEEKRVMEYQAVIRTQKILLDEGKIIIP